MAGRCLAQFWLLGRAAGCACGQRVWKRQPVGGLNGLGTSPCSIMRVVRKAGIWLGDRRQQRLGIGVQRPVVERLLVGDLDQLAEIHHRDAVADVLHHRKVMGNEQIGEAEALLQILQQVDDLRLDRDVERRHRLVADDQVGIDGEGAGDADALALPARELVRITPGMFGRQTDDFAAARARARRVTRRRRSRGPAAARPGFRRRSCAD